MKQIYSIITMAAAAMTASAATPTAIPTPAKATSAVPQITAMTQAESRLLVKDQINPAAKQTVYFDGEEGTEEVWTSIGTGKITAVFLEPFGIEAEVYDITIEETPIEGGRKFRCLPLSTPNNIFRNLGVTAADTENYMVFYAMEDGKNYFEDFSAYGLIPYSQYVPESDWDTDGIYATFDGETWTVPVKGVLTELSATGNAGWRFANTSTPLTIAFPGAKDYTATITTWICGEDVPGGLTEGSCQAFTFSGAEDAAYVKYGFLPGHWEFTMNMAEFTALYGTKVDAGKTWKSSVSDGTEPGIYTAFVGTFDSEDNCKDIKSSYFFVLDDDQDNWEEAGTATWNESLYAGSYNNWDSQELTMAYEEHKDMPGYIRLVNPYAAATTSKNESLHDPCESHNHYIYIDATNPDQVKVEPSVTGGNYDGRGVVMSLSYKYENSGSYEPEEIKEAGFYGTLADNKISFPQKDVVFGEKNYNNGAFLSTSVPFEVTLTPKSDVTAEPTITLNETAVEVEVGKTVTLIATIENQPNTDEVPTWSSADTDIATVDSEGVVTGVSMGTTTITASYAGKTATCEVTVVDPSNMITEITANGNAEAFDLQGRRIATPTKGLYIVRQGNKVIKTIVK